MKPASYPLPVKHSAFSLMLAVLIPFTVFADRILLKNGNTIEGIVSRESESSVTIRLGGGSASFHHTQIQNIERDTPTNNALREASWKEKYYLSRDYIPAGYEGLALRYRTLTTLRRQAIEAQHALLNAGVALHNIEQDLTRLQTEFSQVNAELRDASPISDLTAYNETVARNNRTRTTLSLRQADLANELAARSERMKTISSYLAALQDYSNAVSSARSALAAEGPRDETGRRFTDKLAAQIQDYAADFKGATVTTTLRGNSTIIAALINGRAWGNFIVDTGAEMLTLSQAFADQAGVNLADGRPAEAILANGARVRATNVRLASVKVGGIDTPDVTAAVLPYPPGPDVDGLLGMNVLSTFLMRLDPATGQLELERFSPP